MSGKNKGGREIRKPKQVKTKAAETSGTVSKAVDTKKK